MLTLSIDKEGGRGWEVTGIGAYSGRPPLQVMVEELSIRPEVDRIGPGQGN